MTATLEDAYGKTKRVRFDEPRPIATPRPTKYVTESQQAVPGELVFFDTDDGVTAGQVMSAAGDKITVQRMESNDSARVWLPLWQTVDERTIIRKKQPIESEPLLMIVRCTDTLLTGGVSTTGHLTQDLRKALKAMLLAA